MQRQRGRAASEQQAANPQQIRRAQQLNHRKQQRRLAQDPPADNGQKNIQTVSGGNAETQADAAAQAIADGVAHQQKKIRPGTQQGDKMGERQRGEGGGKERSEYVHSNLSINLRSPYASVNANYCLLLIGTAHTGAAWRRYS